MLDVTGNIGVSGTVDGIDIAARDAVLTSTTTTAGAALPKAGGTMTGALDVGGTITGDDGLSIQGGTGNAYLQVGSDTGSWTWKNYRSTHKLALEDSDGTGEVLNFDTSGNATFAGTISSGAITSTGLMTSVGGVINTNTGSNALYITRLGNTNESLKIHCDDRGAVFESIQDETADTYGNFIFAMDAGVTEPYFDVRKGTADNASIFRVDGGGNVGIGTTSPTDKLAVAGALRLTANISFDANKSGRIYKASNHGLAFHGVTGSENDFALFTTAGQLMVVNPTGTNNLSLIPTAAGNVGIGTSTPVVKFHTTSGVARTSTAKTETAFFASDDSDDFRYGLAISHKGGTTDADRYASIDSTAYRISTDAFAAGGALVLQQLGGNVGIGDTTPTAKLTVENNAHGDYLYIGGSTQQNRGLLFTSAVGSLGSEYLGAKHTITAQSGGGEITIKNDSHTWLDLAPNGRVAINHGLGGGAINSQFNVFADGEAIRLDGTANTSRTLRFRNVSTANPGIITADGSLEIGTEDANTSIGLLSMRDITYKTTKTNSTAGHHKFFSHNTEIMRIDGQNNRVGIGTDAPLVKLDVRGSPSAPATSGTAQTGSLRVSQTAGNGVLDMGFYTSATGTAWIQSTNKANLATNYGLTLQPNGGNVGIGTTAPLTNLHIGSGTEGENLGLKINRGATTNFLVACDGTKQAYIGVDNSNAFIKLGSLSNHPVQISQANANAIYIDTSKNVGIGTSAPIASANKRVLAVQGAWGGQLDIMVGTVSHAQFGTDNYSTGQSARIQSRDGIIFKVAAGTVAMKLDSNGTITQNTTSASPVSANFITGNSNCDITMKSANSSALTRLRNGTNDFQVHTSSGLGMAVGASGHVGVFGSGASSYRTDTAMTSGTAVSTRRWGFGGGTGGTNSVFYIINEGNAGVYVNHGNTSWTAHSDERIKDNIVLLGTVLPDIMNMRCVKYNRFGDNSADKTKIGFIAQDWETVFPEVVDEMGGMVIEADGTLTTTENSESDVIAKGVSYTETIPVLLKAIQEQQTLIEALTARIIALEG